MVKKHLKVLEIVEDEETLRTILAAQFNSKEFKVKTAKDGEEGLKVALRDHPDLILLDLLMPKMDGLSMLKLLRADEWGKNVPVIILTVVKDDKHVAEAMELGGNDYLVKSNEHMSDVVKKVKIKLGMK